MKIGIDARLWGETGVGRYIRNLVRELQDLDNSNNYVLFVRKKDYEEVRYQISNFTHSTSSGHEFQIKIADIRWHSIQEQVELPKILEKEKLDLMHFPYFSVPIIYSRPYVVTIHDLIINHFPTGAASTLPAPLYQLKRIGYKFVISNAVKKAKKIIAPSYAVKDELLKTYKIHEEKVVVTYEGVDEKISNSKFQIPNFKFKNVKYFLYVGNAYPHKNLERLIAAFSQMVSNASQMVSNKTRIVSNGLDKNLSDSKIKLLLVGKDDYFYKKLSDVIKKEKKAEIIIMHNVADEELAEIYKNAIALVAPSLMEGFGLPVLEAIANMCLVLISDIPSFREVAGDAAVYFDPYSVDDIKSKLLEAVEMKNSEKEKFIELGAERATKFSWRKMAEKTLQVYLSVNQK